jgi:dTDP-4-amino-4,6-dideoxygalactose transaminase
MYVPTFQGLSATDFVRPTGSRASCFPFDVADGLRFYRARNAIYHLFRALGSSKSRLTVLAPDYNSGNEVAAVEAAGAKVHYYTVGSDMQVDPYEIERLCKTLDPDVLYVIHYLGWPQAMPALVDLCRQRDMLLVEDCALALLSSLETRPLGTFGDWAVFCLYKTLPVPNGALLVQNATRLEALDRLRLRRAGTASVLGRTAELVVQRIRSRRDAVGAGLHKLKHTLGRAAGALDVDRAKVGDIGFNLAEVDLQMSVLSERLLKRLDFTAIRRRRVENFHNLSAQIDGAATKVRCDLSDGVCPLFFPILVPDKQAAADALRRRGVDALEFWNYGIQSCDERASANTRFLRRHLLGLPIHQDLTPRHISHMAQLVSGLHLRMS